MANLTKCMICGEQYNYCPNCANTHAWRFYTDTHEHYQIYMIIQNYITGNFSIEAAKTAFENIGINKDSKLTKFKPNVAEQIKEIVNYTELKPAKKENKNKKDSE